MKYYLDSKNGDDVNAGTDPSIAWKSLSKLYTAFESGKFAGGDHVLFKRGGKWKPKARGGRVRVRNINGATHGNPLHLGAYGVGPRPAIDGEGDTGFYLVSCNGNEDRDENTAHVIVSDLKIAGNHATHIALTNCLDWQVRNCVVDGPGVGIGINGSSENVTIESCEVISGNEGVYIGKANESDSPHNISVLRCVIHDGTKDGIDFKAGCRDCAAEGNVIYNRQENGISARGENILIANNEVSGCERRGIAQFDKTGRGLIVYGNTIAQIAGDNTMGIAVSANSYVVNNVVEGCGRGLNVAHGVTTAMRNTFIDCQNGIAVREGARVIESFNKEV